MRSKYTRNPLVWCVAILAAVLLVWLLAGGWMHLTKAVLADVGVTISAPRCPAGEPTHRMICPGITRLLLVYRDGGVLCAAEGGEIVGEEDAGCIMLPVTIQPWGSDVSH